jgi:hypothetical protein
MVRMKLESWLLARYQDYVPLWKGREEGARRGKLRSATVLTGVGVVVFLLLMMVWINSGSLKVDNALASGNVATGKPIGMEIVGLVFYGRRANVQILERYLRVRLRAIKRLIGRKTWLIMGDGSIEFTLSRRSERLRTLITWIKSWKVILRDIRSGTLE